MSEKTTFDVIVVGLGAMGSSTCYQLAKRGLRVLGLEQFSVPHGLGSSHGYSRITRLAYYEHPDYVPLLHRSLKMWDELEDGLGQKVFWRIGCLSMGPADGKVIGGIQRSCSTHNLPHERLAHAELRERYPQFRLPENYVGVLDSAGGALIPEKIVAGHAELAMRLGAVLHGHESVTDWHADNGGVSVTTARGQTYRANHLIFCGGAWSGKLVADLGVKLNVSRQVLGWVWPKRPELFSPDKLPVWILDHGDGSNHYGMPMLPDNPGFKLAVYDTHESADPDTIDRSARPEDENTFRPCLRENIPDADGPLLSLRVCMYTQTPDSKFILDHHPAHQNVSIACGFSGHGFKFTSVIGEIMADFATKGSPVLPTGFLSLRRFAKN